MAVIQSNNVMDGVRAFRSGPAPLIYKLLLAGLVSFSTLCLLALVDLRRGFLFQEYATKTPYFSFSPLHLAMFAVGILGLVLTARAMLEHEGRIDGHSLFSYVRVLALVLFVVLIVDLFIYRGVAAGRIISAGQLGAGWMDAFGLTGWARPVALGISYILTVWHATLLGVLLAGLALTVLPTYLRSFFIKGGFRGSVFGSLFALPQPFCSCCAAVIAPSYVRQGASNNFSLAFVVGAPMLNVTGLILAAVLLPAPYALTRVLAGILLALPVTYAVAWISERWKDDSENAGRNRFGEWISQWVNLYCKLFHLEEMAQGSKMESPTSFLKTWLKVSFRVGLLLVPTMFILTVLTAGLIQIMPAAFGNNVPSVVMAAAAGTLLMISTWTEIPVAQQMIAAGLSGPAATMLVVLPPVSLPCMMLLGGSIGSFRTVALLGAAVTLSGIVAGVIFL